MIGMSGAIYQSNINSYVIINLSNLFTKFFSSNILTALWGYFNTACCIVIKWLFICPINSWKYSSQIKLNCSNKSKQLQQSLSCGLWFQLHPKLRYFLNFKLKSHVNIINRPAIQVRFLALMYPFTWTVMHRSTIMVDTLEKVMGHILDPM